MSNLIKFYLATIFWTTVNMFTSGTVVQTFMMENGFSEQLTNTIFSCGQIITLTVMLLTSPVIDKIHNVIKANMSTYLLYIPFILVLCAICFYGSIPLFLVVLLCLTVAGYSVGSGLHCSLSYKVPYAIMDIRNYGRVTSVSGILTGIMGLLLSLLLTWMQNTLGYRTAMTTIYLICLPLIIVVVLVSASMKALPNAPMPIKKEAKSFNYLRFKPFTSLIAANFLRGFGTGILNVVVTIGYYCGCIDSNSATILVIISNLTTFLGCGLYSITTGKLSDKRIILISALFISLSVPFMLVGNNTLVFLITYAIATTFWTVINYAIPVAVVQIADYSIMGQYSAGRMLLHIAGSSLAGVAAIPMIKFLGPLPTMLLTAGTFLFCGISYYVYMKKNKLR